MLCFAGVLSRILYCCVFRIMCTPYFRWLQLEEASLLLSFLSTPGRMWTSVFLHDDFESTPLFMALEGDDLEDDSYNPMPRLAMVRFLLEEGADALFVGGFKQMTLHWLLTRSSVFNDSEVVDLLLAYGVDISARDFNGQTALHLTTGKGSSYCNISEFLLKHGVQVDVRDNRGETPFFESASSTYMDNEATLLLLVENGAQVDAVNEEGKTPLLSVVRTFNQYGPSWFDSGLSSSIEVLLELGADANFTEAAIGETALL